MTEFDLAPAIRTARVQAILSALDAHATAGRAEIYGTAKPAPGAPAGAAPLAVWTLATPAGAVADGVLTLAWAAPVFAALATGEAVWGRLLDGAGAWVADGNCGGTASDAAFRLGSTAILAGALHVPGVCTLTD